MRRGRCTGRDGEEERGKRKERDSFKSSIGSSAAAATECGAEFEQHRVNFEDSDRIGCRFGLGYVASSSSNQQPVVQFKQGTTRTVDERGEVQIGATPLALGNVDGYGHRARSYLVSEEPLLGDGRPLYKREHVNGELVGPSPDIQPTVGEFVHGAHHT